MIINYLPKKLNPSFNAIKTGIFSHKHKPVFCILEYLLRNSFNKFESCAFSTELSSFRSF